jgi:hypothetical protein
MINKRVEGNMYTKYPHQQFKGVVEASTTRGMTALVYGQQLVYIQVLYRVDRVCQTGLTVSRGVVSKIRFKMLKN